MGAVRELLPSVLVIDKSFGYEALSAWLESMAGSRTMSTVVWGHSFTEAECVRLVQAGVKGVLRKTSSLDSVLECLTMVAAGMSWVCANAGNFSGRVYSCGRSPLTAREAQVMDLVEQGLRNKDIAAALGIRVGTVKIHLKHLFEKTGIRGRYGLALSGLKQKALLSGPARATSHIC